MAHDGFTLVYTEKRWKHWRTKGQGGGQAYEVDSSKNRIGLPMNIVELFRDRARLSMEFVYKQIWIVYGLVTNS